MINSMCQVNEVMFVVAQTQTGGGKKKKKMTVL